VDLVLGARAGADELVAMVDAEMPVEAEPPRYRGEVANRWQYRDGNGEVGIIASVTKPFCGDCTRARLSAEGRFYTCLFTGEGHDLRAVLRDPELTSSAGGDLALREAVAAVWRVRDDRYSEERTEATSASLPRLEMFAMGG
jgi:cyclic pyranopterin phosphate synthase